MKIRKKAASLFLLGALFASYGYSQSKNHVRISGVYPHLSVYNLKEKDSPCAKGDGFECGIGGIVPWADKLWMISYGGFCPYGSSDKLWVIDKNKNMEIHPLSLGGTPANRMIHKESNQLIIGPHVVDAKGNVRNIDYNQAPGRYTATARHLTDPANYFYMQDMEGRMYEVNVHTLKTKELFTKPVPGWHGKGAYTGQGRYIISNNGEGQGKLKIADSLLKAGSITSQSPEDMGVLAEYDGENWRIIERRQFTDVTGPGGIYGNEKDSDPIWSMGWDKRSVILRLLDEGKWYRYRLPKATNTYDYWQGHYTEWPRIREVSGGKFLMDMNGMYYDFPKTFTANNTAGIAPLSSHLKVTTDFADWNGELVISCDETSLFGNPIAGRCLSNLWFGKWNDLSTWGPRRGYGNVWKNDVVNANVSSDPFLVNGFDKKMLHVDHDNFSPIKVTIEVDYDGNNKWVKYRDINIKAKGYEYFLFPENFKAQWVRLKSDTECKISASFYLDQNGYSPAQPQLFNSLKNVEDKSQSNRVYMRPSGDNLNLQILTAKGEYYEMDDKMNFTQPKNQNLDKVSKLLERTVDFSEDDASIIVERAGYRIRLPKGDAKYSNNKEIRGVRQLETERFVMNIGGTFYEVPEQKFPIELNLTSVRPIATHNKEIYDFCTWKGLLVISGVKDKHTKDSRIYSSKDGKASLWFGSIEDMWYFGKPVGVGGPWKNTNIHANSYSDQYLMTGYDKKKLTLKADKTTKVTIELDVDFEGWKVFKEVSLKAGQEYVYEFEDGFNANWIRFKSDVACNATAQLVYN